MLKIIQNIVNLLVISCTVTLSYQNIVFDLGGVLLDDGPAQEAMQNPNIGFDITKVTTTVFWKNWTKGLITKNELVKKLSRICKKEHIEWVITKALSPHRRFINETIMVVKKLKTAGYHLYLLSNFSRDAYNIFIYNNDFFTLFDGMLFSFEVGCLKPDHKIYELLFEKHHLDPTQCLFIDDTPSNISAAQELGMKGIVYQRGMLNLELEQNGIQI